MWHTGTAIAQRMILTPEDSKPRRSAAYLSMNRKPTYKELKQRIRELEEQLVIRSRAEQALRESENRYRDLSIIDDLTQLYNCRHFCHQLKMEIERVDRYGQPLSMLLLDLDDFKRFNDVYGHIAGDQVLARLGQVIKQCLRQSDSAYRYGGEEFTILLPMTTDMDGTVIAERIRTEFKKEHFLPKPRHDTHMTVSIGLAQYEPGEDMKAYVHRVDQLMYEAKGKGKNMICWPGRPTFYQQQVLFSLQ